MPYDAEMTTTSHKADQLTSTSALALYDAATTTEDKLRAAAAMAHVLRTAPAPKAKRAKVVEVSPRLTAEGLGAALKRACAVIERRSTIPVLATVRLDSAAGWLTLYATDLDMEWSENLPAEGLPAFAMCVPAHDLAAALRGVKGEVEFRDEGMILVLIAGGAEVRLPGLPVADMPKMADRPTLPAIALMPAARLLQPLAFVRTSVSEEETRYYLNGAYMHLRCEEGRQKLAFVSTDGSRLLLDVGEDAAGFADSMPGVTLPRKTMDWMLRHLDAGSEIVVEIWPEMVRVTSQRGMLTSKVIDGNYPDYNRVIPNGADLSHRFRIEDGKAFGEAMGRLAGQSNERSASVRLSARQGKVDAIVRKMEGGNIKLEVPATHYDGPGVDIAFNARHMRDMAAPGGMLMAMGGPNDPALLAWDGHPGRTGVLMPLRV